MVERLSRWIVQHPWTLILMSLVFVGVAGAGMQKLWITTDYKTYFTPNDPQLLAQEKMDESYSKGNNVIFIVSPKNGTLFQRDVLNAIHGLTIAGWQTPYAIRVDSLTNYVHSWADGDDLIVEELFNNPSELSDEELEKARERIILEPIVRDRLIDQHDKVTVITITLQLSDNTIDESPKVAQYAENLFSQYQEEYPEINFYLTGTVIADKAFGDAVLIDAEFLTPLSYGVMVLLLVTLLRSVVAMIVTLLVVTLSIVFALGVHGYVEGMLNPMIAFAPYMILTISVADCVHLFVTYFHELGKGESKENAMAESLRINFQPVFLTSLTTAIGFLSLHFSDSPAFHVLGNVVAFGVMAAFVLTVLLLPSIMVLLPVKKSVSNTHSTLMLALADFVINRRHALLVITGFVLAVCAFGFPKNKLDEIFTNYFDDTFQFRRANDFANQSMPGMHRLDFSLSSGEADGIFNPDYLEKLERFSEWLMSQPEVGKVVSFSDIVKKLNMNMHDDNPEYRRIPGNREEASQYYLLYELSLPFGRDLTDQVTVDRSETRLTAFLWQTTSERVLEINELASQWLEDNTPNAMHTRGASVDVMFSAIARSNINSMMIGTFVALVLISFVLVFALGSWKMGIVSLVPNLLPAVMAFGIWGYFVGRIGLTASTVASMTLGLVVDDTVHFLSKYLRARREDGADTFAAVRYAFDHVGMALLVTTVVFVIGFAVLSASHYAGNSQMGLLTAITIAVALFMDFFFLPPLLMLGKKPVE